MAGIDLRPLPHREAVEYFTSKGYAPQLQRFHHLDLFREEHARNWVVAKAMRDDVSRAIREEMTKALAEGRTLEQFQASLAPRLQAMGWWGRQIMTDPVTGEEAEAQLGSMRRLRTIFDTNMRTAHAAGHWAAIQRTKRAFPYLQYIQIERPSKRHDHTRFHDRIWHVDDPIWQRIYPPNGFFCGCHVIQRTEGWMQRNKREVDPPPDLEERPWVNKRTGEVFDVPRGVHPGFDNNPGAAWLDITEAFEGITPDLDASQRAESRGVIEGLRLRRVGSGVGQLAVTDPAGSPLAMKSGTAEAPDVRLVEDMPAPPGSSVLRASATEAPPHPFEIEELAERALHSTASITASGAIWRVVLAAVPPRDPMAVFADHARASAALLASIPAEEAAIVYRHAMMLWLERHGVITYHFRMSERVRQILAAHADLLALLLPV